MEYRKIVVGVDFVHDGSRLTPGSVRALRVAGWLATTPGVRVTLVHSQRADERWHDGESAYMRVGRPTRQAIEQLLAPELAVLREGGVEVALVLSDEPGALAITRQALRESADLVIVGKRAETDRDGRKLGSVSMKLLRECPCAVWVAKPDRDEVPVTVLAATDLSPVGTRALEAAAELAAAWEAALHVVYAFDLPLDVQLGGGAAEAQHVERMRAESIATLEAQLAATPMAGKAELHVGLSSPSRAVLACEERLAPDLLVMGTVGRGGIPGLLIGNTAERLLGRLDCSILAVKPGDFVCPVAAD